MDRKWHVLFCDEKMRECPVSDFLEECRPKHQVKILRFLTLLEEYGPTLPRPYADLLHDGIHELRIKLSGAHIRILYFFCHREYIILYHAFLKNTRRVPDKFVREVIAYRDEFLGIVTEHSLKELVNESL